MGARKKLNQAFIGGSLIMATAAGAVAQSWAVFLIAAIVLIALSLYAGDIRTGKRGW